MVPAASAAIATINNAINQRSNANCLLVKLGTPALGGRGFGRPYDSAAIVQAMGVDFVLRPFGYSRAGDIDNFVCYDNLARVWISSQAGHKRQIQLPGLFLDVAGTAGLVDSLKSKLANQRELVS